MSTLFFGCLPHGKYLIISANCDMKCLLVARGPQGIFADIGKPKFRPNGL